MAKRGHAGGSVALVSTDGKFAYLQGTRYFKTWQDSAPRGFVDKVEIKWPDGLTETIQIPGVDRKLQIVEGKGVAK